MYVRHRRGSEWIHRELNAAAFLKSSTMYTETKWKGGWGSGVGMGSEGLLMLNVNSIKFCSPHELKDH